MPAAATPGNDTGQGSAGSDDPEVAVGEEGPTLTVDLETSLFTNLAGPGAVGVSVTGRAMNTTIVRVDVAVVFRGVGDRAAFVSNPFFRSTTRSRTVLHLPFFDTEANGDFTYEDDDTATTG